MDDMRPTVKDLFDLLDGNSDDVLISTLRKRIRFMVDTSQATGHSYLTDTMITILELQNPPMPPEKSEVDRAFFRLLRHGRLDIVADFLQRLQIKRPDPHYSDDDEALWSD